MELKLLTAEISKFVQDRDWEQFHTPKNLALALGIEVSELQELMLWTTDESINAVVEEKRDAIENEVGDILIYLLRFCEVVGIDPLSSARKKVRLNEEKYPIDKAKGNSKKYNEL